MHIAIIMEINDTATPILRYGGKLPSQPEGVIKFSCPDVDVLNIFKIEVEE